MLTEDIKKLETMSISKQIAFCYLACERMFPIYKYFVDNYHFGDSNTLRRAIDLVYHSILNAAEIDNNIIDALLQQIFDNTPHTDDFESFYATLAVDSGGTIYESLNLLKKTDVNRILNEVSDYPITALDCYIQVRDDMDYNDKDFESKIANDPLMQTEIAVQEAIIAYLDKIQVINESDIKTLIKLQGNNRPAILL